MHGNGDSPFSFLEEVSLFWLGALFSLVVVLVVYITSFHSVSQNKAGHQLIEVKKALGSFFGRWQQASPNKGK